MKWFLIILVLIVAGCGNNPLDIPIENFSNDECYDYYMRRNQISMLDSCQERQREKNELRCKKMGTTKGCKIIKHDYWDLIDCNGKEAYYLPQMCHEPYDPDDYIYINGNMYVWSYIIGKDGEIINTKPCALNYACENKCFEKRVNQYREEYTEELDTYPYCNGEWCGLKPFINDHPCGCEETLLDSDRCQLEGKW